MGIRINTALPCLTGKFGFNNGLQLGIQDCHITFSTSSVLLAFFACICSLSVRMSLLAATLAALLAIS